MTPPPIDPTPVLPSEVACADWEEWHIDAFGEQVPTSMHSYWVNNNVWNKEDAFGEPLTQCILRRRVDGRNEYGWRWQWPFTNGDVKGYPEIIHGWKPWNNPTRGALPLRISELEQLEVSFETYLKADGWYNMAFSMWITSESPPSPEAITHEIMIWTDRHCEFVSYPGREVAEVEIDGRTYTLVVTDQDTTGGQVYISFTAHEDHFAGTLDLRQFLEVLVEGQHVPGDHYVTDVELGNETISGTGEMWLKHFAVEAR